MENQAELIREQMRETRSALSEKLETLEEQVTAKVKETTETVAETVETVKGAVENTVQTVSETVQNTVEAVKDTFDMSRHVEEHPWLMFGGAVAAGFVGARILEGAGPTHVRGAYLVDQPSGPPRQNKLMTALTPALSKLTGLAVGATMGFVGEYLKEAAPVSMRDKLYEVLDEFTVALGGTPLRLADGAATGARRMP
jgi:ElaB/YqjD/DUF883 family membrane-anchored ribosome-binding protein